MCVCGGWGGWGEGRSSEVNSALEFKSEDRGRFDPVVGAG